MKITRVSPTTGKAFPDRLFGLRKRSPTGSTSSRPPLRRPSSIEHRLIPPMRPQTNGNGGGGSTARSRKCCKATARRLRGPWNTRSCATSGSTTDSSRNQWLNGRTPIDALKDLAAPETGQSSESRRIISTGRDTYGLRGQPIANPYPETPALHTFERRHPLVQAVDKIFANLQFNPVEKCRRPRAIENRVRWRKFLFPRLSARQAGARMVKVRPTHSISHTTILNKLTR